MQDLSGAQVVLYYDGNNQLGLHSILGVDSGKDSSPGVYLREDPICGTQLENQCELRAPTAERAAHYLDAAISARTIPGLELIEN